MAEAQCAEGGSELATACDLVYVSEHAQIGYPPVRSMSPPDLQQLAGGPLTREIDAREQRERES